MHGSTRTIYGSNYAPSVKGRNFMLGCYASFAIGMYTIEPILVSLNTQAEMRTEIPCITSFPFQSIHHQRAQFIDQTWAAGILALEVTVGERIHEDDEVDPQRGV